MERRQAWRYVRRIWITLGLAGTVVASQVAAERGAGFTGPVLIGTSHPRDVDLGVLPVAVLLETGRALPRSPVTTS